MYVCMYVCIYVCMYAGVAEWLSVLPGGVSVKRGVGVGVGVHCSFVSFSVVLP